MSADQPGPWARELDDLTRGFGGAFLFGVPLLMTMEMWWTGTYLGLSRILGFLALAFGFTLFLNTTAGFRQEPSVAQPFGPALKAVAIGLVSAAILLAALNRIQLSDPLDAVLGKIIIEAVPLSIGASVANAIVSPRGQTRSGQGEEGTSKAGSDEQHRRPSPWKITLRNVGATTAGGVFIGFTIAPTVEVPMLAVELGAWHIIAVAILTLVITHAILFESGFSPQRTQRDLAGLVQKPYTQSLMVYAMSLVVAVVVLFFFGRVGPSYPLPYMASLAIVLGLPVSVGGAAGRLAL